MGRWWHRLHVKAFLFAMALLGAATSLAGMPNEASFLAESEAAMKEMMIGMEIKPSGDVDRDFVAMMIPHHQGAIAMAQAELRYGSNEQLRRLAQEIIVSQSQEIQVMRLAIPPPTSPSARSSAKTRSIPDHSHASGDQR